MPCHILACHAIFWRAVPCHIFACHEHPVSCHVRIFAGKMFPGVFEKCLQPIGTWVQNIFRNLVSDLLTCPPAKKVTEQDEAISILRSSKRQHNAACFPANAFHLITTTTSESQRGLLTLSLPTLGTEQILDFHSEYLHSWGISYLALSGLSEAKDSCSSRECF